MIVSSHAEIDAEKENDSLKEIMLHQRNVQKIIIIFYAGAHYRIKVMDEMKIIIFSIYYTRAVFFRFNFESQIIYELLRMVTQEYYMYYIIHTGEKKRIKTKEMRERNFILFSFRCPWQSNSTPYSIILYAAHISTHTRRKR